MRGVFQVFQASSNLTSRAHRRTVLAWRYNLIFDLTNLSENRVSTKGDLFSIHPLILAL
jgi:hypothetical protein